MPLPSAPEPSAVQNDSRPLSKAAPYLAVALGLALLGASWLLAGTPADAALFHAVNAWGPAAPMAWSCLTVAGLAASAWIYIAAAQTHRPDRLARLLWIIVVGGVLVHLVKYGIARPRPFLVLGADHLNVVGHALKMGSMPSGHAATAFALVTLMLATADRRSPRAWLAGLGWVALGLGIALSRLAVGAHWPSDVLAGGGLGVLVAMTALRAWPVDIVAQWFSRPIGSRVLAASLVALAIDFAIFDSGYPLGRPLQYALVAVAAWGAVRWWRASGSLGRRASAASHQRG